MDVWWEWYQWYIETLYKWNLLFGDLDKIIRNDKSVNPDQ